MWYNVTPHLGAPIEQNATCGSHTHHKRLLIKLRVGQLLRLIQNRDAHHLIRLSHGECKVVDTLLLGRNAERGMLSAQRRVAVGTDDLRILRQCVNESLQSLAVIPLLAGEALDGVVGDLFLDPIQELLGLFVQRAPTKMIVRHDGEQQGGNQLRVPLDHIHVADVNQPDAFPLDEVKRLLRVLRPESQRLPLRNGGRGLECK